MHNELQGKNQHCNKRNECYANEALEMQILLIKYCDYLTMSNNLYGARETNIVLILLYTVIM